MNFILQKRCLPAGWYPETEKDIVGFIASCPPPEERAARLCVVPHAGWFFSGELAWQGISSLSPADTIIILGGHLPPGDTLRVYDCDAFETPLGNAQCDRGFLEKLAAALPCKADFARDNTVEVQLPFVKYAFPRARIAALRVPPSGIAAELGQFLCGLGESPVAIVASTDLTHYGPNYDFSPHGCGPQAEKWAREENDLPFLEALAAMDCRQVLQRGQGGSAACSAGAAAAAAACAAGLGLGGRVVRYATSLEKHRSSSFVGYGVVVFR
ncbi:MAG: AmmeMemoRadiSam system protein B [Spirochaetia bacterium]|jgi:AmmeMemoRadiSam system protein B|nr:AmmeMemoRadiSam system protein B [Spirochaetia bacterium]